MSDIDTEGTQWSLWQHKRQAGIITMSVDFAGQVEFESSKGVGESGWQNFCKADSNGYIDDRDSVRRGAEDFEVVGLFQESEEELKPPR